MKSVGEVMAIGRTFQESLQKALRWLETGLTGLDEITIKGLGEGDDRNAVRAALGMPTPDRLLVIAQAMRHGLTVETINAACKIDPWFLGQIRGIVETEAEIRSRACRGTPGALRRLKAMGFSDARLAKLTGLAAREVTERRHRLGVRPVFKRIDTCAAEFASPTAYMYSTYEAPFAGVPADEAAPSDARRSSFSAAARTASARASSSTTAAATPASRWTRPATRPSWSTAIRRRCRPTTTPRIACISSR